MIVFIIIDLKKNIEYVVHIKSNSQSYDRYILPFKNFMSTLIVLGSLLVKVC